MPDLRPPNTGCRTTASPAWPVAVQDIGRLAGVLVAGVGRLSGSNPAADTGGRSLCETADSLTCRSISQPRRARRRLVQQVQRGGTRARDDDDDGQDHGDRAGGRRRRGGPALRIPRCPAASAAGRRAAAGRAERSALLAAPESLSSRPLRCAIAGGTWTGGIAASSAAASSAGAVKGS